MNDETKEYSQGWFIPATVIRLYESGKLNAEEMMLLSKLNAMQNPKKGYCWASNQWLAGWWKKTDTWVSKTIAKFSALGLISLKIYGTRRYIKSRLFLEVSLNKTSSQLEQNFKLSLNKTSSSYTIKERVRKRTIRPSSVGRSVFLTNPENSATKLSPDVMAYAEFSRKRRFHLRPCSWKERPVYAKGGSLGGWSRPTLIAWEEARKNFLRTVPEDTFSRLLAWYLRHFDDEWLPECRTMLSFIEKFSQIDRQKRRGANKRNGHGEERPENDPEFVGITEVDSGIVRHR